MLAGLTPYGRQHYGYLLRSFHENYRAKSSFDVINKYVPKYRWGQFRRDWGITRRAYQKSQRMKFVHRPETPSEDKYIPSPTVIEDNYHTVMKVHVYDKVMEEYRDIRVTIRHDIRIKRYELEKAAKEDIIDPSPTFDYISSAPEIGYKRMW